MLLKPHSIDRGDMLTDAVMQVLAESGAVGLSVRAICKKSGFTPGGLTSLWGSRQRMLHIAVNCFRARWQLQMAGKSWRDGVMAFLPDSSDGVSDCLVWAGFCELARQDEVVAECVAAQREDERQLLRNITAGRLDESALDHLVALIDGLRLALCAPHPLGLDQARTVLDAHLGALGVRAVDLGLTGPPDWFLKWVD